MSRKGVVSSTRKPAPWKPERGQYVRLWPTRIAVPEWAGFTIAMLFIAAMIALAVFG
jgi:hypothetical protein